MIRKPLFFIILSLICLPAFALDLTKYKLDEPVAVKSLSFLDDKKSIHNLNDYTGKVVLVNFWATWCKPCLEEMPEFEQLKKSLEGRNIEIIPLSLDYKGADEVIAFYNRTNITGLPVYNDDKGSAFKSFGLKALPTTIIINKKGEEVVRVLGSAKWNTQEVHDFLIDLTTQ